VLDRVQRRCRQAGLDLQSDLARLILGTDPEGLAYHFKKRQERRLSAIGGAVTSQYGIDAIAKPVDKFKHQAGLAQPGFGNDIDRTATVPHFGQRGTQGQQFGLATDIRRQALTQRGVEPAGALANGNDPP